MLTGEQHSVDLPTDLSALQALAASTSAPAQAVAVNQAILAQAPEDVPALNRLGRAQQEIGHIKDAATTFGRVLVIDQKDPVARKHVLELAKKLRPG